MLTGKLIAGVVLAGALAAACSSAFSVEDAPGTWDVQRINGVALPGDVWFHQFGGDSALIAFTAWRFELLAAPDCSSTVELQGGPPLPTNSFCSYAVAEGGGVSITLGTTVFFTGTADGIDMSLTDDDSNVYVLHKRS